LAVEALYDAAQEDAATGGPNPLRGIYPTVKTITADGVQAVGEDEVRASFESIVGGAQEGARPHGGSQARETENDNENEGSP
ncbi:MAG TPA: proteasome subunit beta, partial [Actinomycetota bacterium]